VDGKSNEQRLRETYNTKGGRWAIVTGASEGLGREFAHALAKSDFNLMLVSRSEKKLSVVRDEILRE